MSPDGDLERAVAALPERERKVILLTFVLGLTQRELAVMMGVSRSMVWQLHDRALRRLGICLHLGLAPESVRRAVAGRAIPSGRCHFRQVSA